MEITVNNVDYTNIHFAYFAKPIATTGLVNSLKESLQVGDIQINGYVGRKTEDIYFAVIRKILNKPRIKAMMLLPVSVFSSFIFDKYVYIKHKDFQGYFFVEKIENYKDGKTPARVYLNMVDPQTYTVPRAGDVETDTNFLQLETADYYLLETGDKIILE